MKVNLAVPSQEEKVSDIGDVLVCECGTLHVTFNPMSNRYNFTNLETARVYGTSHTPRVRIGETFRDYGKVLEIISRDNLEIRRISNKGDN